MSSWTTSTVYVEKIRQMARAADGKDWGPSFGAYLKLVVLHELGHHAGREAHATSANAIMGEYFHPTNNRWEAIDGQWFASYFGYIPTSIGGGSSSSGGTIGGSNVFSPPWNSPYDNNLSLDAPFDPGCKGGWRLSFNYDFEQGWDTGHFFRHDNGTTQVLTGMGAINVDVIGAVHFAIFTDYSIVRSGFTNVKATCY